MSILFGFWFNEAKPWTRTFGSQWTHRFAILHCSMQCHKSCTLEQLAWKHHDRQDWDPGAMGNEDFTADWGFTVRFNKQSKHRVKTLIEGSKENNKFKDGKNSKLRIQTLYPRVHQLQLNSALGKHQRFLQRVLFLLLSLLLMDLHPSKLQGINGTIHQGHPERW